MKQSKDNFQMKEKKRKKEREAKHNNQMKEKKKKEEREEETQQE